MIMGGRVIEIFYPVHFFLASAPKKNRSLRATEQAQPLRGREEMLRGASAGASGPAGASLLYLLIFLEAIEIT